MIYLAFRGFTLMQLGIFESIFHLTSFLMEVPTGAIADIWGRKLSRLLGRVCFLISLLIMFYSSSFFIQLVGFMICAIGYNLESGAGDALIFDSLKLDGKDIIYMKIAGKRELTYQSAAIIAYLVGGYLATRSYPAVFSISMGLAFLSVVTAFFFMEPILEPDQPHVPRPIFATLKEQTVKSVQVVKDNPRIGFLILFSELIFTGITTEFFYLQNYWKGMGYTEFMIGIIFAVSALVSGITGYKAAKIEKRIGVSGVLVMMPIFLIFCLWGIALTPLHMVFYALTGIIDGILIIAISDYINRLIPSEQRATILSFQSMAFSFLMIIFFPIIGFIGDTFSLETSFFILAAFMTVLCAIYLIFGRSLYGKSSQKDH